MKNFTITHRGIDNNIYEMCECAGRSNEAIKNAINDILILKNTNNYIIRCTNESNLEWLFNIKSTIKKDLDRNSLTEAGKFILKEIKDHITQIFHWLKNSLISALDL